MEFPEFRPHPFVRGGHAQTLCGFLFKGSESAERGRQHIIELSDGDRISLHDDAPDAWRPADGAAVLVHGLTGSHRSAYMVRVADKLNRIGVRTFRMNLRGCGTGVGLARLPYNAGQSGDVREVLAAVSQFTDGAPLHVIGFSLGGNIVLKLAGEGAGKLLPTLRSAMAVNPPVDLQRSVQTLNGPLNRIYDRHFVGQLIRDVTAPRPKGLAFPVPQWARVPRRLYEFDDLYTAPLANFSGAEEYYAKSSAGPLLAQIALPTCILTAHNDPLVPYESLTRWPRSESVRIHVAEGGGHLGYLARRGADLDRRWMEWRVVEWISSQRVASRDS